MAGRAAKGSPERNGQAQRLSLKRWYETVTISKQLDSDRRAAYVPEKSVHSLSRARSLPLSLRLTHQLQVHLLQSPDPRVSSVYFNCVAQTGVESLALRPTRRGGENVDIICTLKVSCFCSLPFTTRLY